MEVLDWTLTGSHHQRCAGAVGDMKMLVEKALTAAAREKRFVFIVYCAFAFAIS